VASHLPKQIMYSYHQLHLPKKKKKKQKKKEPQPFHFSNNDGSDKKLRKENNLGMKL
jgi:hypothetical protein